MHSKNPLLNRLYSSNRGIFWNLLKYYSLNMEDIHVSDFFRNRDGRLSTNTLSTNGELIMRDIPRFLKMKNRYLNNRKDYKH
jgi:hypothetical protein